MKRIIIKTPGSESAILIGAHWQAVVKLLPERNVVILTDNNVLAIYGKEFPGFPVISIEPGEGSKQLGAIERLAGELLQKGIDRSGFILAIGGGVVCDVAGFLASVYMRGIRCGYVSTSLLAQVDASTGGKTGVNLGIIKNVIGSFSQPEFVICDTSMPGTLPEEEYMSGLAELIKTGLIGDKYIIETLETNHEKVLRRDRELLTDLVFRSVKFKASVVAKDEREAGLRRILNFGHTFGHAIELYEGVRHGYAVASGMKLSTLFSFSKGLITRKQCDRVLDILHQYKFSGEITMPPDKAGDLILHDKKKTGGEINFVFLKGIGKAVVIRLSVNEIIDFYKGFKD